MLKISVFHETFCNAARAGRTCRGTAGAEAQSTIVDLEFLFLLCHVLAQGDEIPSPDPVRPTVREPIIARVQRISDGSERLQERRSLALGLRPCRVAWPLGAPWAARIRAIGSGAVRRGGGTSAQQDGDALAKLMCRPPALRPGTKRQDDARAVRHRRVRALGKEKQRESDRLQAGAIAGHIAHAELPQAARLEGWRRRHPQLGVAPRYAREIQRNIASLRTPDSNYIALQKMELYVAAPLQTVANHKDHSDTLVGPSPLLVNSGRPTGAASGVLHRRW